MSDQAGTFADTFAIAQLIYWERHLRDKGEWDAMKACYYPTSLVRVAWFQGSGPEFVEASKGLHRDGQSKHRLSPTIVRVNGDHGVAETDTVIEVRTEIRGIEADIASNCRLLSRVLRDDGTWRLASLDCIYEKDAIRSVIPAEQLPIDSELLRTFRPSYRFICYNLHVHGRPVNSDLPGDDRKDLVDALYQEANAWLSQ